MFALLLGVDWYKRNWSKKVFWLKYEQNRWEFIQKISKVCLDSLRTKTAPLS